MRVQIISDIHLELRDNRYPHIPRHAPNIALLGDIGKPLSSVYRRFIHDLSRRFDNVIVIAGNHEFFSSKHVKVTVQQIKEVIRSLCAVYANVHFLDNSTVTIDGVRILGCTLWTHIPEEMWQTVRRKMNDYRMTFVEMYADINVGVPLSPHHTMFWHEESVTWLKRELALPGHRTTPTLVLTHHAPYHLHTSDPRFIDNDVQCCYATDLSSMFRRPILVWAYGHTHYPQDFMINGVRLVSNPLGYPDELPTAMKSIIRPPVIDTDEYYFESEVQISNNNNDTTG